MSKKNNLKDIRSIFENRRDSKSQLALNLIDKIEFMEKTLLELQDEIDKNGTITEMCQGNYSINRANPALQAYNVTIKNYTSSIKQLVDMLPDGAKQEEGESLLQFMASDVS